MVAAGVAAMALGGSLLEFSFDEYKHIRHLAQAVVIMAVGGVLTFRGLAGRGSRIEQLRDKHQMRLERRQARREGLIYEPPNEERDAARLKEAIRRQSPHS
jgi:hypothetical protein